MPAKPDLPEQGSYSAPCRYTDPTAPGSARTHAQLIQVDMYILIAQVIDAPINL